MVDKCCVLVAASLLLWDSWIRSGYMACCLHLYRSHRRAEDLISTALGRSLVIYSSIHGRGLSLTTHQQLNIPKIIMFLINGILLLLAGAAVLAQRSANTSICDFYTQALLKSNTAANQKTLLTLLVNTVIIGNCGLLVHPRDLDGKV